MVICFFQFDYTSRQKECKNKSSYFPAVVVWHKWKTDKISSYPLHYKVMQILSWFDVHDGMCTISIPTNSVQLN